MHFILRLQQMHAVFFFNLKAHALAFYYVFIDFISFGPNNFIYMAVIFFVSQPNVRP